MKPVKNNQGQYIYETLGHRFNALKSALSKIYLLIGKTTATSNLLTNFILDIYIHIMHTYLTLIVLSCYIRA